MPPAARPPPTSRWPWCCRCGRARSRCCSGRGRREPFSRSLVAARRVPRAPARARGSRSERTSRARSTSPSSPGSSSSRRSATLTASPVEWQLATAYLGLVPLGLDPALPPDTEWYEVDRLPKRIAFDHQKIVLAGRERLRAKLSYTNIGFALAPKRFSVSELSGDLLGRSRIPGRPDQFAPRPRAPRPARGDRRAPHARPPRAAGRRRSTALPPSTSRSPIRSPCCARRRGRRRRSS